MCRVLFPGALNSEFTSKLEFLQPSKSKDAISTYRCLNQYGEVIDKKMGADTTDEEALELYKNMVKRKHLSLHRVDAYLTASSQRNGPPHV